MHRLFRSKTCFRVLTFFSQNKGQAFYLRQLALAINADPANVNRELKRLVANGFVEKEYRAKRPFYRITKNEALLDVLSALVPASSKMHSVPERVWTAGLELGQANHLLARCWMHGFVSADQPHSHKSVYAVFDRHRMSFYYDEDQANMIGKRVSLKPEEMESIRLRIVEQSEALFQFAYLLPQEGAGSLSADDLMRLYQRHEQSQRDLSIQAYVPIAVDREWRQCAMKRLSEAGPIDGMKQSQALQILIRSGQASMIEEEIESLLSIASHIQADPAIVEGLRQWHEQQSFGQGGDWMVSGLDDHADDTAAIVDLPPDYVKELHAHHARYGVIGYASIGETRPFSQVLAEVARLVYHDQNCAKTLARLCSRRQEMCDARSALLTRYRFNHQEIESFRIYGEWQRLKQERRFMQEYALYKMRSVLEAIAAKLAVSLAELDVMLPQEIEASLLADKPVNRSVLRERLRFCLYTATPDGGRYQVGGEAEINAAALKKPSGRPHSVHLRGTTARRGYASGPVRIVCNEDQALAMKKGDVIVAPLLRPELVMLLSKAAAFITEQGGITSHAAILARELNIPCIVGVQGAVSSLADGVTVEVDADHGIIRVSY